MATKTAKLQLKSSTTAGVVPTGLLLGEAAVNIPDGKLFAGTGSATFQVAPSMTEFATRLQFDAAQTLTAGQKTQGQTNLGVDPTTLDARYNRIALQINDGQAPNRLLPSATFSADFNTAITSGWYCGGDGLPTANAPGGGNWFLEVRTWNNGAHVMQTARSAFAGLGAWKTWQRYRANDGSWSAWLQIRDSDAELDARYAQVAGPTADVGQSLGTASRRWSDVRAQRLTVGGNTDTAAGGLNIDGAAGSFRAVRMQTAGLSVWTMYASNAGQSGGNVGSDFGLNRFNDAGAFLGTALLISRATGQATFEVRPNIVGAGALEDRSARGVANGYAPLGADNLVPSSYLPVSGSYKGTWNANTNTPALTTTPSANGDFYIVSVAGTQSVTGTSTAFAVGDQLRSNGTAWQRIPSANAVPSVFGRVGPILSANGDYNATQITYGATTVSAALDLLAPLSSPALTGTPTAPTAAAGTSTTQLATTAFVTTADALKAPLASPALTGTPTAPTAALGTNTTQLATMAALKAAIENITAINGGTY